jgi:hypothetical protein
VRILIASLAALALAASAKAEQPAAASKSDASAAPKGGAPVEVHPIGTPGMAGASRVQKLTAKVKGVDAPNRVLILDVKGKTENVKVGPDVNRFDEIAAGDTIAIEIEQGLLLEYQPAGSETVEPTVVSETSRAQGGPAPAGAVAQAVQSTVTITAIDAKHRMVVLQGPHGNLYQVKAGPKVQLEKLKVGDKLLATYAEAVALKLEKKKQATPAKESKTKESKSKDSKPKDSTTKSM